MKMVIGILLAFYFFGMVPFLAGVFWDTVTGAKEHRLVRAYVNGYIAMFAAFWCVAFVFLYRGCTLKRLCLVWLAASAVICIISGLVGRKRLLAYGRHAENTVRRSDRLMRIAMLVSVVLLLLSVAVFKPRVEATVETVATAVATDSTYIYQPYTGEQFPVTQTEKIKSPYEMLYAPMVQFSGGEAAFLIKIILPFFLIPFFYGVCAELGRELFFEQRKQAVFLLITEALYTAPVYTAVDTSVAGIFQNCWNGDVLLNCCVLPFAFLQILRLADVLQHGTAECRQREKIDHPGIHAAGMLLLSYPAAQLCAKMGWFFILLMTILLVVVLVVRKGCEYVSAMDRH